MFLYQQLAVVPSSSEVIAKCGTGLSFFPSWFWQFLKIVVKRPETRWDEMDHARSPHAWHGKGQNGHGTAKGMWWAHHRAARRPLLPNVRSRRAAHASTLCVLKLLPTRPEDRSFVSSTILYGMMNDLVEGWNKRVVTCQYHPPYFYGDSFWTLPLLESPLKK
jgi:hypothetical protein